MSMIDDEGGEGYPPRRPRKAKGKAKPSPGMKTSMPARPPNVVPGVPTVGGAPPPMPGPSGDALAALGYKGKK